MVPAWLVPLSLFAGATATVITYGQLISRRRTGYVLTGYRAGVNAAKLPSRVDVCRCGHPRQEHLNFPATNGDRCLGVTTAEDGSDEKPCDCKDFTLWYVDGEHGTCECGSNSFRDVTICLSCGRWQ